MMHQNTDKMTESDQAGKHNIFQMMYVEILYPNIHMFVCVSVYLCVCLSVCLSLSRIGSQSMRNTVMKRLQAIQWV